MERKIQWCSGCFDEIDLVYEKAEKKDFTIRILHELEAGALEEAKTHCRMIQIQGQSITPRQFDSVPSDVKEQLIATLSNIGLSSISSLLTEPKITIRLSSRIQRVRCCTAFNILNRLEKLDGSFNMLHPQATLELQVPLGGKQGLLPIEMLIMQLYPWLKVTETSTSEAAADLTSPPPQQKSAAPKAPVLTPAPVSAKPAEANTQPGFWKKLLGGKTAKDEAASRLSADPTQNPQERFYREMWTKPAFRRAFSYAAAEINNVIIKKQFKMKDPSGSEMTAPEWNRLSEIQQLRYILSMGNHGIVPSALLCIDFVEIIPYCLAITLLYLAYTGQKETQMLDTGDRSDNTVFKTAVAMLSDCCPKWNCKILT